MVEWWTGKDPSLLDSVSQKGRTPLHAACGLGNLSVAKKLVELEPTLLQRNDNGKANLLRYAVFSGNLELFEWLAGNDTSLLDSVSQKGRTPLHTACRLGILSVAEKLVELEPTLLQRKDNERESVLHSAVFS